MIASILALALMQVGPNPSLDAYPGTPDELRNRPPREKPVVEVQIPAERQQQFADCLTEARDDPETALDTANTWRMSAENDLDLVRSAHCLGLAFVALERFDEARQIFEVASAEAPEEFGKYRARLLAMAGNAAMSERKPAIAEPLFATAIERAVAAGDGELASDLSADRAGALALAERFDDAVEAMRVSREHNPQSERAWIMSAMLLRRLERYGEAQQMIEQAATINPRNPAVGLEAGIIAALSGREDDARRSFESVLIVAPDSEWANRATAYLEQLNQ